MLHQTDKSNWIIFTLWLYSILPLVASEPHWAFHPIRNPTPPELNAPDTTTPIDQFLLSELSRKKLAYSPPADRRTLIRRATFDLTGLPPTPAEVDAFQNDTAPDAFARVIDRLLNSPHYGERWGRHWLDVARYADNKGYVFFEEKKFPWAYTYRDYVVDAFNNDVPYNRFILEQLAADQIDLGEDKRPLAAMGFLTLGARFMNSLHDVLDDRIDVTTRGLLGLTTSCARCHDHKYDPISQADYYSLYGVFRSSVEPTLPPTFKPPPDKEAFAKFDTEMKKRTAKLEAFINRLHGEIAKSAIDRMEDYLMAAHALRDVPPPDNFMLITPKGALNPSVIHLWRAYLADNEHHSVWIPWHLFAELPTNKFEPKLVMDKLFDSSNVNPAVYSAIAASPPKSMNDVAKVYATLLREADKLDDSPRHKALKRIHANKKGPVQVPRQLGWGFLALIPDRETQGEYKKVIKEVEDWSMNGKDAPPRAMILVDADEPYDPRIFLRGNPNQLGEPVPRQFLTVLNKEKTPFKKGSGRLELAQAITHPDNPLTARVIVNRVWHHHFGQGLVSTPSDFGLRGAPPSHPQLLDYLASTFMKNGWSIKQLHRRIMLTAAYQQSNQHNDTAHGVDPDNRLLWRFNRQRLDFESTRDSLLAVSGSLDPTLGGPAQAILGKSFSKRRTLYGFIDRMDLPGLYRAFDFPDPAASCPQRDHTTVAPQALYFMNHPFVAECATRLVNRPEIKNTTDQRERLNKIYRLIYGRSPTEREQQTAAKYFGKDLQSPASWAQYIHALLMTNEFVYVD